jgi:hypothetical protein
MIGKTTGTRIALGAAFAVPLLGLGIVSVLLLTAQGGEQLAPVALEGVPLEDLTNAGYAIEPVALEQQTTVSASAAVERALTEAVLGEEPGTQARVRQTVLLRLLNPTTDPPLASLTWAVNIDPASVKGEPPHCVGCETQEYKLQYMVFFVDANTGEPVYGLERSGLVNPAQGASPPVAP